MAINSVVLPGENQKLSAMAGIAVDKT